MIREARKAAAREKLEALLLEGVNSGEPELVTPEWWEERRRELRRRLSEKSGK